MYQFLHWVCVVNSTLGMKFNQHCVRNHALCVCVCVCVCARARARAYAM